ncbi:hypothetical protein PHLCEN_2v10651 [Hermanssonia centrifuga]|uniref:1-alkyl-2-acetylglycerophosphocholine esterase n=1 Tax=Hermanssonia centrifuga TaxID=98765 RepID=A0A2R6NM96_9APHY|nr:hypothetical protein PHLCEN_2v10651 [Hermanssonia centrifuga]
MAKRTPNFWYRMIACTSQSSYEPSSVHPLYLDPLAAAAIHGTTFPASKDAPLATPPHTMANGKWPLMIFSHGVGCSRLMYSAFCGEMASRGYVVAVLEHRDGTSPSSTIAAADGTTTTLDWIDWPELEEQPPDDTILRHEQIKLRVAEVEATVDLMRRLSRGEPVTRDSIDSPDFDWERWKYMDASRPVMAGHSLGGSAALAASSTSDIDFRSVVVFDPAVQRLEPWKSPLPHPLLVINSSEFTLGREYAIFSTQITRTVTNSLLVLSIGGATHPSFSDVFLILPAAICRMTGLKASPAEVISKAVKATEEWLAGKRVGWDGVWQEGEDREEQAKEAKGRLGRMSRKGKEKYMPAGKPGELSWHPL